MIRALRRRLQLGLLSRALVNPDARRAPAHFVFSRDPRRLRLCRRVPFGERARGRTRPQRSFRRPRIYGLSASAESRSSPGPRPTRPGGPDPGSRRLRGGRTGVQSRPFAWADRRTLVAEASASRGAGARPAATMSRWPWPGRTGAPAVKPVVGSAVDRARTTRAAGECSHAQAADPRGDRRQLLTRHCDHAERRSRTTARRRKRSSRSRGAGARCGAKAIVSRGVHRGRPGRVLRRVGPASYDAGPP
jgi:hypothetical protein